MPADEPRGHLVFIPRPLPASPSGPASNIPIAVLSENQIAKWFTLPLLLAQPQLGLKLGRT